MYRIIFTSFLLIALFPLQAFSEQISMKPSSQEELGKRKKRKTPISQSCGGQILKHIEFTSHGNDQQNSQNHGDYVCAKVYVQSRPSLTFGVDADKSGPLSIRVDMNKSYNLQSDQQRICGGDTVVLDLSGCSDKSSDKFFFVVEQAAGTVRNATAGIWAVTYE
ncbi:MAG: hypothetical protein K2P93_06675 [Alphaproteobacteria bacterium]|nr:hypothetical protein [Alphaproteobacteria bacterium]